MNLTAVYRVYPNATPPTAWTLGSAITTVGFKFTKRAGQASSCSFKVIGACPLVEKDRIFAYGLTSSGATWTWGGVVFTKVETKIGYEYQCLDFIDALEGLPVTGTYPGSGSNDTDTEILTNILTLQKSPLGLSLDSTGITPTAFRELVYTNEPAKSILEQFCTYGGHKFSCYQTAYNSNPRLQYFHPSGGASGISLAAGDIFADWSIEKSRSTLANKVVITAEINDVPAADKWCLDIDTADLFGYHTSDLGDLSIGKVADTVIGFHFKNGAFSSKLKNICVYAKKVGTPTTDIDVTVTIDGGSTSYSAILVSHDTVTTSYAWYTLAAMLNPTIPAYADVYVQFETYDNSDTDYYKIAAAGEEDSRLASLTNTAGSNIWDAGASIPASPPDVSFQIGTVSLLYWTVDVPATTKAGYSSGDEALVLAGSIFGSNDWIRVPISPPISHADYGFLKFSMKGGWGGSGTIYLGKEAALTNFYWSGFYNYNTDNDKWVDVIMPIGSAVSGFITGWTASGSPDWDTIAEFGMTFLYGTVKIRDLRFEGSSYTKTVEDANSQAGYEEKYYPEDVPFQTKAEVDAYAAAILAAKKDPQSSISVRANGVYAPALYTTVSLTLGGNAYTPLVIGYDIDPVKGETKFIFDAYSARDLSRWIAAMSG